MADGAPQELRIPVLEILSSTSTAPPRTWPTAMAGHFRRVRSLAEATMRPITFGWTSVDAPVSEVMALFRRRALDLHPDATSMRLTGLSRSGSGLSPRSDTYLSATREIRHAKVPHL